MTLLIILITMEILALIGWISDTRSFNDDSKPSFIINHVVFVIIGAPFTYWILTL